MEEIRPGRYRHFKGKEYRVLCLARHSETEEWMGGMRSWSERGNASHALPISVRNKENRSMVHRPVLFPSVFQFFSQSLDFFVQRVDLILQLAELKLQRG